MVMEVKGFSFSYPSEDGEGKRVLEDIDLQIDEGAFVVLCGHSGCGKTTLLRCMKEQIAPVGDYSGSITKRKASEIGFVFQNPDNQIVTDTVRHELAFGMENMGLPPEIIRQRAAETALFLGMDEWLNRSVYEISGGEKQLLNLASIIAMRPRLLLLDEPTAQLDPHARKNFLDILSRVNKELGIAVLLCEHNLEEVLPLADHVLYMEEGRQVFSGGPREFASYAGEAQIAYEKALPAAVRLGHKCTASDSERDGGVKIPVPLTVREGVRWAGERAGRMRLSRTRAYNNERNEESCLRADNLYYQYGKEEPFVIRGLSMDIVRGSFHAVLGGNGSGKTTLLSLLSKRCFAQRGKIRLGRDRRMPVTGLLPQNPKAMFSRDSVEEELGAVLQDGDERRKMAERMHLEEFLKRHPYDLSGGEQQRLALALVLAGKPDLLLLDEPTKGLDPFLKEELGELLQSYVLEGNTVVCVTHDVEFAAQYAQSVSLLFEGEILATRRPEEFFTENAFFTTDAARILRNILPGAVTCEDVAFV